MTKEVLSVIWIEALIAFLIPFLTALGIALAPYVPAGSSPPSWIGLLVIICAPLVAGLSALKSFMSTVYSDAQDTANKIPSVAEIKSSIIEFAKGPAPISGTTPETKP